MNTHSVTIAVFQYTDTLRIELVKSRLRAAGIEYVITGDMPLSYADKTTLCVQEKDAALATTLLEELDELPSPRPATVSGTLVASVFVGSAAYWGVLWVATLLNPTLNIDSWGIRAILPVTIAACFLSLKVKDAVSYRRAAKPCKPRISHYGAR